MLHRLSWLFILQQCVLAIPSHALQPRAIGEPDPDSRGVFLLFYEDVIKHSTMVSLDDGSDSQQIKVWRARSELFVQGTAKYGPMYVALGVNEPQDPSIKVMVQQFDTSRSTEFMSSQGFMNDNKQGGLSWQEFRDSHWQDDVHLSNDQINQAVTEAITKGGDYRLSGGNAPDAPEINDANTFFTRVVQNLGIQVSDQSQLLMQRAELATKAFYPDPTPSKPFQRFLGHGTAVGESSGGQVDRVPQFVLEPLPKLPTGDAKGILLTPAADPLVVPASDSSNSGSTPDSDSTSQSEADPKTDPGSDTSTDRTGTIRAESTIPLTTDPDSKTGMTAVPQDKTSLVSKIGNKFAFGQWDGMFSGMAPVAKIGAAAAGAAGIGISAAFVIVDFIQGNFEGAAIGLTALAVAAIFAVAGPEGLLLGGILSAAIGLIAMLTGKEAHLPTPDDQQQILQWSFFGDSTKTGAEACPKQNGTNARLNCTTVYGPGVLAIALGLSLFDAVVFLVYFNNGMAMSIPDMSNVFDIIDPTNRSATANSLATIDCGNRMLPHDNLGGPDDPDTDICHPKYYINRSLIILPTLNVSAQDIIPRMMPAKNGDCKLLTYPTDQHFPDYNVTLTGLPSSILCNATNSVNLNGTAGIIAPNGTVTPATIGDNGQNATLQSLGSSSTTGGGADTFAPPPPSPFLSIFNTSSSVCLGDTASNVLCLAPGMYGVQNGSSGFAAKRTMNVTVPAGASLGLEYPSGQEHVVHNYSSSVNGSTSISHPIPYLVDMQFMGSQPAYTLRPDFSMSVKAPSNFTEDWFCLFDAPNQRGNAACFGLGGAMLPSNWQNKTQSIRLSSNAGIMVFANAYGDATSRVFRGNVDNLADATFGTGVVAVYAFPLQSHHLPAT